MSRLLFPLDDRRPPPDAAAVLVVYLLFIAGMVNNWGFFTWRGLVLMVAATALMLWIHIRPLRIAVSAVSLWQGILLGSMVADCFLATGQNQLQVTEHVQGAIVPKWRFTAPGIAIKLLEAAAILLLVSRILLRAVRWTRIALLLLVCIAIAARVLIIFSTPYPCVDLFVSQTSAGRGLLLKLMPEADRTKRLEDDAKRRNAELARLRSLYEATQEQRYFDQGTGLALEAFQDTTLRDRLNVYSMTFPSPYYTAPAAGEQWYDAKGKPVPAGRFKSDGTLYLAPRYNNAGQEVAPAWFTHYAYPPETVYANAVSWKFFGDVRGVWVICDLLAALFLFLSVRAMAKDSTGRRIAAYAALTFLFMPRSVFVIEQSFTEPLVICTLGAFALAFAKGRGEGLLGFLFGLWVSSKQYVAVVVPLVLRLRRCRWATWLIAFVVGVLLLLPFAIANFGALYQDLFGYFIGSAARGDALSLVGAMSRIGVSVPWWIVLPVWVGTILFFHRRMMGGLGGWLLATAGIWLCFFMFGKQATVNYFYVVGYALIFAAGASDQGVLESAPREVEQPEREFR